VVQGTEAVNSSNKNEDKKKYTVDGVRKPPDNLLPSVVCIVRADGVKKATNRAKKRVVDRRGRDQGGGQKSLGTEGAPKRTTIGGKDQGSKKSSLAGDFFFVGAEKKEGATAQGDTCSGEREKEGRWPGTPRKNPLLKD